jgi:hypothetical protein
MSEVGKLEELLARIQRNRGGHAVAARSAAVAQAPVSAPSSSRKKTGPTPLELAVEGQLTQPTPAPPASREPTRPRPATRPVAPEPPLPPAAPERRAQPAPTPEPPRAPVAAEPRREREPAEVPVSRREPAAPMPPPPVEAAPITPAGVAPPSAPIIRTTGEAATEGPPTFGGLLDRSLRLRPR